MRPPDLSTPFVLLDDARDPAHAAQAPARLYRGPVGLFRAARGEEVERTLAEAGAAAERGLHVAGYIAYEAGLALEPRLAALPRAAGNGRPLVWLAAFEGHETMAAEDVADWLAGQASLAAGPPLLSPLRPAIERAGYDAGFARIREAIAAGDIYQANLTFPLTGRWAGDPLAIYARLRARAAAGYAALVFDGERHHLSLSPELFFALKDGDVTLKPMKGTRPRGSDAAADEALAGELAASEKDRAENLMITDLMRNDVSRLAVPGSVTVRDAFRVETYPTVHQMTSTVRARLRDGAGALDLLRAIFPCGSITGAPKIRAMELIDAIEDNPRNLYCGAIGRVDPGGDAAFNVAIRTLTLDAGGAATMGVGSGLVIDSRVDDEWAECLVKGSFVAAARPDLRLIETMAFDPMVGVPLIELHLKRLKVSAAALGFAVDRHALRNHIQAFCFLNREPRRLRVLVDFDGNWDIEGSDLPAPVEGAVPVTLHPLPVAPDDWRLRYKTSDRAFYDTAREEAVRCGATEAVLVREDGFVTEGSFTNIFVERDGMLLTPPAERGLLPGVLRASLIEQGRAVEADLTAADLARGFWIGNALRGLMPARLIDQD
ncbi:aminodeoxychorismate synthase component I [Croceicoccus sp. BE223]|uniref:aminodeoxychorismate synthase component I n=1 Tax=Croceicoccus sp. BE223 TaxID=2817716 RepID=UPI0028639D90|nr:aminodeoxychorismate synthase component I [Croceicoccus sp. BE223]MDR7102130.1 para-aminobenzoate synthetase/4-amino-4-deoxychorismate lyase [Croceicoccus sp. BE223]